MLANRPRIAQLALAVVIVSMALPWARAARGQSETVLRGYDLDEGRFVILIALASIAAIELQWRPAWIGTGLVVATVVRSYLDILGTDPAFAAVGDDVRAGLGIWIAGAAGVSALVVLVWNMFSDVAANAPPKEAREAGA